MTQIPKGLEDPVPSLADSCGNDEEQTSLLEIAATATKPLSYGEMTSTVARSRTLGMGRFVSPDKIGGKIPLPQSWNRYSYSLGNPVRYVDPNGQAPLGFSDYAWIAKETTLATVDQAAFLVAQPLLRVGSGILNNDPGEFLRGTGEIAAAGVLGGALSYAAGPATAELTTLRTPNPWAPAVENPRLQNAVDELFRPGRQRFPGGTAGAIREGGSHVQKGKGWITGLERIIKQESLTPADRATALRLKADLEDAIRRIKLDLPARPVVEVDQ